MQWEYINYSPLRLGLGDVIHRNEQLWMPSPIAIIEKMKDGAWYWSFFAHRIRGRVDGKEPDRKSAIDAVERNLDVHT
jgi:hypothetical protein